MADLMWALECALCEGRFDMVASHALIDHAFEFAVLSPDPWTVYERRHVDRFALLQLLPQLACVSKQWNLAIKTRVEYAALRAAPYVHEMAAPDFWLTSRGWLEAFDEAIDFFTKSWSLWDPLPESLRTTPLDELSDYELGCLVHLLRSSCNEELVISAGDGMELLPTVWVTPAQRA